ncbi:MAG: bifunctional nicotinamidase/pyrazinamidase [Deltaproteobacteria bacterium]|jgi:nicotinamidase/pyrazinamidase|nr:bifunctional nicotinamidase/pyrazinamidase [Deltaproteobacteria bacterium]
METTSPESALIIVDLQNDFMPGGPLGVPGADSLLPLIVGRLGGFSTVVATQDWHPPGHGSFASQHPGAQPGELGELDGLPQVMWPDHCVAGTRGAELVDGLPLDRLTAVFRKGQDPRVDSYSGFFDNGRRGDTGLADWLRGRGVRRLVVVGVATDYCVQYTARDAATLGFEVELWLPGCRGVELQPGDVARALDGLRSAGVEVTEA